MEKSHRTLKAVVKEVKMSKIMDFALTKEGWDAKRIALVMARIAKWRKQTTNYTPSYINSHVAFRAGQAKLKATKKVEVKVA